MIPSLMADQPRFVTGDPPPPTARYRNTAATVYPYVSPLPPNVQGAIHSHPYVSEQCLEVFVCVIVFCSLCTLITWLIWLACISYPHFHVETLNASNFTISPSLFSQYSGTWDANVIVRNPNSKVTVYCDKIVVAVCHRLCSISETTLPPFVLGTNNETALRARFGYSQARTYEYDRHGNIPPPEKDHAVIKFNVWMVVRVKLSARGTRRRSLRVFCYNLPILVSSQNRSATLIGGRKKCWVQSSDWARNMRPPPVGLGCAIGLY